MKKFIDSWYYLSVFIAGGIMAILGMGDWDLRERTILAATAVLFLHFFEEFGFPDGFPWIGLHVEMGVTDTDPKTWSLNQLNSLFGNWWCAGAVYLVALALPDVRFLTLAVLLFGFIEVIAHLGLFNIALRTWHNPGIVTAVFGLLPLSINYFAQAGWGMFTWVDVLLALGWIGLNYWFAFRSPLYRWMGRKSDRFAFSEEEVMRAKRYIDKSAAQ